jgi:hypothetical protein
MRTSSVWPSSDRSHPKCLPGEDSSETPPKVMSARARLWTIILVLLLIAAVPYLRVLPAYFVADDLALIPPYLHKPGSAFAFAWNAITSMQDVHTTFYRPLPFITFWTETQVWGLRPSAFHATNILLHALSTVLIFVIARALVTGPRADLAAAAGAVLFAIFPRRVEPVAWISARPDLLCTAFALLCAWLYIESARRQDWRLLAGSTLAFWGALLSKEAAYLLPVALVLVPVPWTKEDAGRGRKWPWLLPLVVSMALYPLVRRYALGLWVGGYGAETYAPDVASVVSALKYLACVVVPPVELARDAVGESPFREIAAVLALGVAGLLGLVAVAGREDRAMRVAVVWTILGLAPVLAFNPSLTSTANDRLLYFPGVGVAIGLAAALSLARFPAAWVLLAVLAGGYIVQTVSLVERWRLAGALTEMIGVELAETLNATAGSGRVYLASVPDTLRGAYMLRSGVQEAAALAGGTGVHRLTPLSLYMLEDAERSPIQAVWVEEALLVAGTDGPAVILSPHEWVSLQAEHSGDLSPAAPHGATAGYRHRSSVVALTAPALDRLGQVDRFGRHERVLFRLPSPGEAWMVGPDGVTRLK